MADIITTSGGEDCRDTCDRVDSLYRPSVSKGGRMTGPGVTAVLLQ